jgi:hypothetical protein
MARRATKPQRAMEKGVMMDSQRERERSANQAKKRVLRTPTT